jgi:hypothetical protein
VDVRANRASLPELSRCLYTTKGLPVLHQQALAVSIDARG